MSSARNTSSSLSSTDFERVKLRSGDSKDSTESDSDKPFELRTIHVLAALLAIAVLAGGLAVIFISQKKIDDRNKSPLSNQKNAFSFDNIWQPQLSPHFASLAWSVFDDTYITTDNSSNIIKVNPANGQSTLLVDFSLPVLQGFHYYSFSFTADEKFVLFQTNHKPLYRHSSYDVYYVLNVAEGTLSSLSGQNAMRLAIFSPHPSRHLITYVDGSNNLWLKDLDLGQTTQITTDGEINSVINGVNDWVYEEEVMSQTSAIYWNPDGDTFAWLRFNESQVPLYSFPLYDIPYNTEYTYKYPKSGFPNSLVSIGFYSVDQNFTTTIVEISEFTFGNYDPAVTIIGDLQWLLSDRIAVKVFPRFQNTSQTFSIDIPTFTPNWLNGDYTQENFYLEPAQNLMVLKSTQYYVDLETRDDFVQIAGYNLNGFKSFIVPVKGVKSVLAFNEATSTLYFSAADPQSNNGEDIAIYGYSLNLDQAAMLVPGVAGRTYQSASFSASGSWFVLNEMAAPTPSSWLYQTNGIKPPTARKQLADNSQMVELLQDLDMPTQVFVEFPSTVMPQTNVNGYWLLPNKLDTSSCDKQVPVLVFVYGGPGDQQVTSNMVVTGGSRSGWHVFLASTHGMAVFVMDGVGTGGRGSTFQKSKTFLQLGVNEAVDVLSSVRDYVKQQCWVDGSHVAIWGWSFGGYLTSMIAMDPIQQRDQVFSAVMSVAPVTDWHLYDSIYTERYMWSPSTNPAGYNISSVLNRVGALATNYIHIHGTGDDNVHVQNSFLLDNGLIAAGQQYRSFFYPNRQHSLLDPITGAAPVHLYRMLTNHLAELGFLDLKNEQTRGATRHTLSHSVQSAAHSSLNQQWQPKSQRHGGLPTLKRNSFHTHAAV